MNILASLLVGLFSGLTDFFVRWVTKKIAIGLSAVAVFAGLTTALYVVIGGFLSGMTALIPSHPMVLMGLWVAIPDNFQECLSAVIAADTAVALYRWNVQNLKLMAYIT